MPPNVLLIVLDSVRARNTSLYGYDRETTPCLETFAEDATLYTQARAPGTGSVQSHVSIFTGLHVAEHGMNSTEKAIDPEATVWDRLAGRGYDTGVFSYNSYLTQAPIGLSDAFDVVVAGEQRLPYPEALNPYDFAEDAGVREFLVAARRDGTLGTSLVNGLAVKAASTDWLPGDTTVDGQLFTDRFVDWHKDRSGPWAACVNYMDAHTPYQPRSEHDQWADAKARALAASVNDYVWDFVRGSEPLETLEDLEDCYDGGIRQADAEVGRLLEHLRRAGDLEDTLVVVTADHGEGFGEPGEVRDAPSIGHGSTGGVEEGVLRVPLVVQFPGQREQMHVKEPATLSQFPAVVDDVINGDWSHDGFVPEGPVLASLRSLPPHVRESVPDGVDISAYEGSARVVYERHDDRVLKYVTTGDRLARLDCTHVRSTEYLDTDVGDRFADAFVPLERADDAVRDRHGGVSGETEARLEALGYR
ncbi:hypothetical protein GCM10028857_21430 [Salinarchaeum chitinilyticum]